MLGKRALTGHDVQLMGIAHLVSSEFVRMCKQLTIMAESLPVTETLLQILQDFREHAGARSAYQREKSCA